jgi:hypothetical protein
MNVIWIESCLRNEVAISMAFLYSLSCFTWFLWIFYSPSIRWLFSSALRHPFAHHYRSAPRRRRQSGKERELKKEHERKEFIESNSHWSSWKIVQERKVIEEGRRHSSKETKGQRRKMNKTERMSKCQVIVTANSFIKSGCELLNQSDRPAKKPKSTSISTPIRHPSKCISFFYYSYHIHRDKPWWMPRNTFPCRDVIPTSRW